MAEIRRLRDADLDGVVALHEATFPGDLITAMGRRYLRSIFYPWYLRHRDGFGIGAVEDGRLLGYVVGSANTRDFYRSMARGALVRVAVHTLAALARHPRRLVQVAGAAFFTTGWVAPPYNAELSYIAVRSDARGKGMGRALALAFLDALRDHGAEGCWVKTHADRATQEFYESLGFQVNRARLGAPDQIVYGVRLVNS